MLRPVSTARPIFLSDSDSYFVSDLQKVFTLHIYVIVSDIAKIMGAVPIQNLKENWNRKPKKKTVSGNRSLLVWSGVKD